ncbi:YadA-like family protein, partial [Veillonella sp. ICM51a]|uniref:YadA-like family protein n=1 Tax=Veillonella sp. ICM51a TaxID=936591 RepID=UPI00044DA77C
NGGNTITNVAAGTNDTDAVNVSQLKGSITTVKSSDGSITVTDANAGSTDPTKGHAYDIKINNQRVVEKAQTPVVYTDKDGHKLYKIVDPATGNVTFNTKENGTGTTVQPNEVIASMNNGGDSTTTPMKLNNVGSSIQKPNSTDTFLKQLDDANKSTPNGAVNVSDLKKTSDALIDKGLVFDANNKDPKTNKLGSKVTVSGTGALGASENFEDKYNTDNIRTNITQDSTGNTTIAIGLNKNLKGLESVSVPGKDGVDGQDGVSITGKDGANGLDGKVSIGKDGKDAVSISGKDGIGHIGLTGAAGKDGTNTKADITVKEGKPGLNGTDGITRIVYKDKDGNDHEVATHDDGLKFTGNNESTENKHKLNSVVKVQGEGVTENATSGKLEANGQEFKSATGNIAVVADGGSTLTVKMNKDLNLTKDGSLTVGDTRVNKDGITITNTDPNKTVSVTGSGLNNGGNTITNVAAGTNDTDAVNVSQLKGSITTVKSSDGSITVTDANAGSTDPTKGHAYDIKVNNQGVVNNAQIPVVYTKDDGTKVYKQPDGTFNTAKDGSGDVVAANKVIASMNNAANSSTDPTKLQNVGSSIADKAGNTYLDKINAAAGDNNTKYGAVNVSDLKNTADAIGNKGLNFGAQSGTDIHKNLGEKLEIVGGGTKADDKYDASNIKTMTKDGKVVIALDKDLKADSVTVGEKGAPGKDGVDGKIGVNGKDGSAVVLNGKDGSIGLNGKDGKNGISIKGQDGKVGVDGKDGETRFVYTEKLVNPDGSTKEVTHEIATMDDGMKYAGDDAQGTDKTKVISKKLNQTVDIVGGADKTKLTDNNIGVNNDGGKLKVQLSSELSGITKISNGGSSITFNSTPSDTVPAVTISGGNLDMGGNKITNVKAGEADTDAVNYKQLKDSRTTVTSQDGSVTITPTPNGDSMNYDLKVNPPLDPRVDQLAEEVGRVGAQGAALSALKPIQYDPLEPTQIMAGYGNYRGNSAIAMGVAHYKNESTLIHGGISWAGGSSHMMANAGVTWKVGNRDSEAAVADRYRKGPISSTYAMQQEMAAMKAQNAGLKGEVSDLKAENEQMKAQIAAMMAKLGL